VASAQAPTPPVDRLSGSTIACSGSGGSLGNYSDRLSALGAGVNPSVKAALSSPVTGKSRDEWRAANAGAFDWGPDVGREVVKE